MMKNWLAAIPVALIFLLTISPALARPVADGNSTIPNQLREAAPRGAGGVQARSDTLFLFAAEGDGSYGSPGTDSRGFTFDVPGGEGAEAGWFGVDRTAQEDLYWHLEDATRSIGTDTDISGALPFDPLDLTNDYAMHCGVWGKCGWPNENGYGNNWDQHLRLSCGDFADSVTIDFQYISDFEGDMWDYFQVLIEYEYGGDDIEVHEIYVNRMLHETQLREISLTFMRDDLPNAIEFGDILFRFTSDGAWSDEDGLLETNVGAVWFDNLVLTKDGTELIREDFESGVLPGTIIPEVPPGSGNTGALYCDLWTQDRCRINNSCAWAFFDLGYTNPAFPSPLIQEFPYLDAAIRSPLLNWAHEAGNPAGAPMSMGENTEVYLSFWVYADMPSDALIYYNWSLAAYTAELGCVSNWQSDNTVYYGDNWEWGIHVETAGATLAVLESAQGGIVQGIQVELGCVDMCSYWCDTQGAGEALTPGPYFDIVRLALIDDSPSAWVAREFHRFQDNFPEVGPDGSGGAAGRVRIDPALNVEPIAIPTVVIGDSAVVQLNMDGHGGVRESFSTAAGGLRPEIWLNFQVIAGPNAGLLVPEMADPDASDGIFSPWEGTVPDAVAGQPDWGRLRADYARYQGMISPGRYAFDFADDHFEPGDVIRYFYTGVAADGHGEHHPARAQTSDLSIRESYLIRCLPTPGRTFLFVDDGNKGLPVWNEAFRYNGYADYDVYATMAAGSGQENGLAGRASLEDIAQYECIVWDSGTLQDYTVCSLASNDKTEDDLLLTRYLAVAEHPAALWLLGDNVANDLGMASSFLTAVLGVNLISVSSSYQDATGIFAPRVFATDPALAYLGGEPSYWADGGCPDLNSFALVERNPSAPLASTTHEWEVQNGTESAGILNLDPDGDGTPANAQGYANPVLFQPFSYTHVRDDGYAHSAGVDYARLSVGHVLALLLNCSPNAEPDGLPEDDFDLPAATGIAGNYPNPFNPETTLHFSLASGGRIEFSIVDIAGRRIAGLLEGEYPAGRYEVAWEGLDEKGRPAASGLYFAVLRTSVGRHAHKLLLLK